MLAVFITNPRRALNLVTKQRAEQVCRLSAESQMSRTLCKVGWGREADAEVLFNDYLLLRDLKVL